MSKRAVWITVGIIILVAAVAGVWSVLSTANAEPESSATPSPSASPVVTPTPVATPTPTLSPTPAPVVAATCENTVTDEFRATLMSNGNGWVSWELSEPTMLWMVPEADLTRAIGCRWGAGPDVATDNVLDLSWAPIDPASIPGAMDRLAGEGYVRIDAPEGVYLALRPEGEGAYIDDEGYGDSFLFTDDDVRWAMYRDEVAQITAPDEVR